MQTKSTRTMGCIMVEQPQNCQVMLEIEECKLKASEALTCRMVPKTLVYDTMYKHWAIEGQKHRVIE